MWTASLAFFLHFFFLFVCWVELLQLSLPLRSSSACNLLFFPCPSFLFVLPHFGSEEEEKRGRKKKTRKDFPLFFFFFSARGDKHADPPRSLLFFFFYPFPFRLPLFIIHICSVFFLLCSLCFCVSIPRSCIDCYVLWGGSFFFFPPCLFSSFPPFFLYCMILLEPAIASFSHALFLL
jgi:hypothetical protein